jgi:hypothetical protein
VKNPSDEQVRETLRQIQHKAGQPLWETDRAEDFQVQFRLDEKISPAKFKADPLIPGGYLANSLTLRAMRPTLFVAGANLDELQDLHHCACGETWDNQFWKMCPHCGRG